jgi:dipeptidyl aminopeptidase/acylaminoacyl peptidase
MRKALVASLFLSALLLAAPEAQAAFPGDNGKIAFDDGNVVSTVNPDGTGLTGIAFGKRAVWSPDGQKLAFTTNVQIYTANPDGSNQTLVLDWGLNNVGAIAWAPDGQHLAASLERCDTWCRHDIYTMKLDGSQLTDLTPDLYDDFNPSWSPDGSRIAFDNFQTTSYVLFTVRPDGTDLRQASFSGTDNRQPSWSPDGQNIVYSATGSSSSDLYLLFGPSAQVTNDPAVDFQPAFSPDGAYVVENGLSIVNMYTRSKTPVPNASGANPDWQPLDPSRFRGYARPRGASPILASLVPAYAPCATPNETHGAPLAFGSCAPPVRPSTTLTVATPDANGLAADSIGSVRLTVLPGNPATQQDEADVRIQLSMTNVRWAASLADYTGDLSVSTSLHITDGDSPSFGVDDTGTVMGTVPVTAYGSCGGGACHINTTVEALIGGSVKEGKRAIWELSQVRVFDAGPDGEASTEPNDLFAVQGVFVP